VLVFAIAKRHQKARVRDGLHFREKPFLLERLRGPATAPASRRNACPSDCLALSS
jgi:hypothetical protein